MPQKLNSAGEMQNYVPKGNGDASGEYGNSANGSNKNFKVFSKNASALKMNNLSNEHKGISREFEGVSLEKITDERVNDGIQKIKDKMSNIVKPFQKQPVNINDVKKRGNLTDEQAKECIRLAEKVYFNAMVNEPKITSDLVNIANNIGVKMFGLDYRRKQITSLAGKIGEDSEGDSSKFEAATNDIKDAVRYTTILDDNNFVNQYNEMKKELEEKGYKEVRCKNYYELYDKGKSCQKAIQCVYENKDGYKFELQFHTPSSEGIKDNYNHKLYEKWREKTTPQNIKEELYNLMLDSGKRVTNPPNIMSIKTHDETK